jgi:hypothetical protein
VSGYILDDVALSAGLAGHGSEHHRRELSRLLHAAIEGGPTLDIPALCLNMATTTRPALSGHLADIIAAAPAGAIDICGLTRTDHLDTLRGPPSARVGAHPRGSPRAHHRATDPHRRQPPVRRPRGGCAVALGA